jgi:hypothetical protein
MTPLKEANRGRALGRSIVENVERVATPFKPENLRLRPQFRFTTQASFFGKEGSVSEVCGMSIWTPY